MGAIDDTRKLLQDLVTPDLKALSVRVEALEKRVDSGFADLKQTISDVKQTIADVDVRAERRHTALLVALHLEGRVKRLEERAPPRTTNLEHPAPAETANHDQKISSCILQVCDLGLLTHRLPAFRPVKENPSREILSELHEAMLIASRHEQNVSRAKTNFFSSPFEASRAGGDHVNLIAGVRMLPVVAPGRVQLHRERAVPKQFHRALAVRAGQLFQPAQRL